MSNLNQNTTSKKLTNNFLLLSLNNEIVVLILIIKLSQFYVLYTTKLNQIQFGPYL